MKTIGLAEVEYISYSLAKSLLEFDEPKFLIRSLIK